MVRPHNVARRICAYRMVRNRSTGREIGKEHGQRLGRRVSVVNYPLQPGTGGKAHQSRLLSLVTNPAYDFEVLRLKQGCNFAALFVVLRLENSPQLLTLIRFAVPRSPVSAQFPYARAYGCHVIFGICSA